MIPSEYLANSVEILTLVTVYLLCEVFSPLLLLICSSNNYFAYNWMATLND